MTPVHLSVHADSPAWQTDFSDVLFSADFTGRQAFHAWCAGVTCAFWTCEPRERAESGAEEMLSALFRAAGDPVDTLGGLWVLRTLTRTGDRRTSLMDLLACFVDVCQAGEAPGMFEDLAYYRIDEPLLVLQWLLRHARARGYMWAAVRCEHTRNSAHPTWVLLEEAFLPGHARALTLPDASVALIPEFSAWPLPADLRVHIDPLVWVHRYEGDRLIAEPDVPDAQKLLEDSWKRLRPSVQVGSGDTGLAAALHEHLTGEGFTHSPLGAPFFTARLIFHQDVRAGLLLSCGDRHLLRCELATVAGERLAGAAARFSARYLQSQQGWLKN